KELLKGVKTGDFIHHIFEHINFASPQKWKYVMEREIANYYPHNDKITPKKIEEFLHHVMGAKIVTGAASFSLSQLSAPQILHEMEFDFSMYLFETNQLENIQNGEITVKSGGIFRKTEGIMKGFVDLFFAHQGRYYVLDWKTNYLGPELKDYNEEAVKEAM